MTTSPDPTTGPRPGSAYATDFAAFYDTWFDKPGITPVTVETLAELAAPSRTALELGIGTGRVALPLHRRGIHVHGVDASPEMVDRLRTKPGGTDIPVTLGDFAAAPVTGTYGLVYLVGGTFFELPTQQSQLDCLKAAARRLSPEGVVALDAHVPEALAVGAQRGPRTVDSGGEGLVQCHRRLDPSTQRYVSHYAITEGGHTRHLRVDFRYASAGELDLMAAASGLRLRTRWGAWDRRPFTRECTYHVSVYERAEG
ncbi:MULTISPECIES: class I SAM-dependent DNA methyltransferase [Streptomyces]|uniref:Class I SAM-dependent DNA methyltransferase n=1 Tax=Streptomyces ramulosus TaxID=47762 RepID=A0ABW1FD35_9ACTN